MWRDLKICALALGMAEKLCNLSFCSVAAEVKDIKRQRLDSCTVSLTIKLEALQQMTHIRTIKQAAIGVKHFTPHSFTQPLKRQSDLQSQPKWFLLVSGLAVTISNDFHKISTKEHFYSNSRSCFIIFRWKLIGSHQTSSPQAPSGFISVPLRSAGRRWLRLDSTAR